MTIRVDTASLIAGKLVVSEYAGLGILGSDIPDGGTDGDSPLRQDYEAIGGASDEWRWEIVTWPSDGTLTVFEDGSFIFEGAPDGSYSFTYDTYKNNVKQGSTNTVNLTVGVASVTVDIAQDFAVRNAVTADVSGSFSVANTVAADIAQDFAVRNVVTVDVTQGFAVINAVTADIAQAFAVRNAVTVDTEGSFAVRNAVTADLTQGFAVRNAASVDIEGGFAVINAVTVDIVQGFAVEESGVVTIDIVQGFAVRNSVSADVAQDFAVRNSAIVDIDGDFAVRSAVSIDIAQSFAVVNFVVIDIGQDFAVRNAVAKDIAQSFRVGDAAGGDCPTAEAIVDAMMARVIDGGLDYLATLRVLLAAAAGRTLGAGSAQEQFLSVDASKPRITTTFDGSGNRQAVTLDGS